MGLRTAFASDFDSTLHFPLQGISAADRAAIARFREAGGLFGINTGRSARSLLNQTEGVLDLDFVIASSGALVLGPDGTPLYDHPLSRDLAHELLARYRWPSLGLILAVEEESWAVPPMSWMPIVPRRFYTRRALTLSRLPDPIYGLSIRMLWEGAAVWITKDMHRRYGDAVSVFRNAACLDVVAGECSKGEGLRIVKRELGVDTFAAMGDSYNDLPQLEAADVAYTFPNAPEEVRQAADTLMPSVASALEDLSRRQTISR